MMAMEHFPQPAEMTRAWELVNIVFGECFVHVLQMDCRPI